MSPPREGTCTVSQNVPSGLTVSIGSDNGLSPGRCQAIIQSNAGIFLLWPLGTEFSEILITIQNISFMKMNLTISSTKWWPSCPGVDELTLLVLNPEYSGRYVPILRQLYGSLLVTWYKKYFSARNIFFSARNIFLRKKYIFLRKKYIFSARNKFFSARNIFFSARNIFFRKKYLFPQEIFFSARNIFFPQEIYFFPQEIYFSARNKFFSARNIFLRKKYFCSDWPSWLHNHLLSPAQTPIASGRQQQCPSLSFIRYRPAGPATSLSSRPAWKVPGPTNCFVNRAVANV